MSDTIFQTRMPHHRSRAGRASRRIGVPVTKVPSSLQCDWQLGTGALTDAIRDHRAASVRVFASRRIAPALVRVGAALAQVTKTCAKVLWTRIGVEQAMAARYQGRAWCDTTEAELNNDITTWRSQRF
jgi:hypothetical protein